VSIPQLPLLPQRRRHLQERGPVVPGVEIAQLQGPGQVVRLGGVLGALVGVLQPAEQLRQPDVHLQLQRIVVNRLGDAVGVLEAVQGLVEAGQFQVDGAHGEVDVAGGGALLAFVVQGVTGVCQGSGGVNQISSEREIKSDKNRGRASGGSLNS
jgi:hypothetical protein